MIDKRAQLDRDRCFDFTNAELIEMCKAKGIGGYSKHKKDGLVDHCCTAPNQPIEKRLGWIPSDGRYQDWYSSESDLYINKNKSPIGLSGKKEDVLSSHFSELFGEDDVYADIIADKIPDSDRRRFYIENRGDATPVHELVWFLDTYGGFYSMVEDRQFLLRSPLEKCQNDYYSKKITETAYESLIEPKVRLRSGPNDEIECGLPLMVTGYDRVDEENRKEKMVMITPMVADEDEYINYDIPEDLYALSREKLGDLSEYTTNELRDKVESLMQKRQFLVHGDGIVELNDNLSPSSSDSKNDLIRKYIILRSEESKKVPYIFE